MIGLIIATVVVGAIGIALGFFLTFSSKKFAVDVDERQEKILELLPGANCGGCGFPGCEGAAAAIVKGDAPVTVCPVAGQTSAEAIAEVMGLTAEVQEKTVAVVKCAGDCDKAKDSYQYTGIKTCKAASVTPNGGPKTCRYGCTGYGDCVASCEFDAIHIVNGVAVVDKNKCTSCGACVKACPKGLIEIVPEKARTFVKCNSKDIAKDVMSACQVGCIGCRMCEKACPLKDGPAITVENNVAKIDYSRCINCGLCAQKCPKKTIHFTPRKPVVKKQASV